MQNHIPSKVLRSEGYVIEIDGKISSEYGVFQEALKAGLELRQKFPHSQIKVHDANDQSTIHEHLEELARFVWTVFPA